MNRVYHLTNRCSTEGDRGDPKVHAQWQPAVVLPVVNNCKHWLHQTDDEEVVCIREESCAHRILCVSAKGIARQLQVVEMDVICTAPFTASDGQYVIESSSVCQMFWTIAKNLQSERRPLLKCEFVHTIAKIGTQIRFVHLQEHICIYLYS